MIRYMKLTTLTLAAAVLAAFCVLEAGRGPPLSFIYFRF